MDHYTCINSKPTVLSAAGQIEKVLKISQKLNSVDRSITQEEIQLIKCLCTSSNLRISQLAIEVLLYLAKEQFVELGQAVGLLVTLLPTTTAGQFIPLSEAILQLLLLDLRKRCSTRLLDGGDCSYVCQFGIKSPQHPVILLIEKLQLGCTANTIELISDVFNHPDELIRENSIEFLRPVLLHLFTSVSVLPESQTLWRFLVRRSLHDRKAQTVFFEIMAWQRSTTASQTSYIVSLLLDALEIAHREASNDMEYRLRIACYLTAMIKDYSEYNYNPAKCFVILQTVCDDAMKCDSHPNLDIILMLTVDMLQVLTPSKACGVLQIINTILKACGPNSRMLTKEAMIQLLGQPTYLTKHLSLCDNILQTIERDQASLECKDNTELSSNKTLYWHTELAKWTVICNWWSSSATALRDYFRRAESCIEFTISLSPLHRSIFLASHYEDEVWQANFQRMVSIMQHSNLQVAQCMIPLLYGLAQDTNAHRRLKVLQMIATMGEKENFIGILKALTKDLDRALCLDLYLRLWKAESRTYPLLYDLLKDTSQRSNEDRWEYMIARTFTIREVCRIKPQQHGEDLVNLFSEVLSNPNNSENEVAICLALDAISSLCVNHVVNIVSTWKVLGFRFANERRPRIIKSLCRFFESVPLIKVTSSEQEQLVNHIVGTLWHYVTDYEDREVIEAALGTLQHFMPDSLTLRQIPELFRQGIDIPEPNEDGISSADSEGSVPPECWIQLIQYSNHCAIDAVGDMLTRYINIEVDRFRSGIYQTPEGRPEPSNLKYLPRTSILSTIINYLISQSTKFTKNNNTDELVLVQMLRIVAKPYSRPIPPLNWCFLHEYFHHCVEMRDYCLQIAIKQMPYSGTAKRLVENYLHELTETSMQEEDLLKIFSAIGDITEAVQLDIYKPFLHLSLQYLAERAEDKGFVKNSPFIQAMAHIRNALLKKQKYENEDNFYHLCMTLENFFMRFNLESKIFSSYIKTLVHLPEQHFNSLLNPSTWPGEMNISKLQKSIFLQFSFKKHHPSAKSLHLLGLTDIVTTVAKHQDPSLGVYFLRSFFYFVQLFTKVEDDATKDKPLISWISELIGLIQETRTEAGERIEQDALFMLDTLATAVISFSGYGGLYGAQTLAENKFLRLELFPLALVTLFQRNLWREVEIKLYEFFFCLYHNASLPDNYADCLRNALICCKKQPYLLQPKSWAKFVSMRRL
ncbi:focadhesin [Anopheles nili]|uniref:focadhesin n=1 Tax=Anopheles nili TaxID=185578 RepID=UPI00237BBB25|nr:focadhesin [Anopheles nili]